MAKTKISELFPYENIVNDKTLHAKVLVWNNRTMLIAEENSSLFAGTQLSFDELLQGVIAKDEIAVKVMLYAAMVNGADGGNLEAFIEYYNENDFENYYSAVLDGIMNYLPGKEMQQELKEFGETAESESLNDEETDHWAFYFYFCKKHFHMSDEEFLNSTWRTLSILQMELIKTTRDYKKSQVVSAEFIPI